MTGTNTAGVSSADKTRPIARRLVQAGLGVLTVMAPFVAILWLGVPSWFPAAITLDTVTLVQPGAPWNDPAWSLAGRLLWSFVVAGGAIALFNLPGWCGRWLPLAWIFAGLAVPQACMWATGQSKYMVIGGLVPFNDACGYFDYACKMLENHRIVGGFTDRPMFSAMLSSILQFTGMNLQPVFAVLLAICGAGFFVAGREMHARFGNVAATVFLFIIYVFHNRTIGTLMTEHLGLALALFSLPLLLRGVLEPRFGTWLAGSFFLSAALGARSGAYFVLPALCWVTFRRFGDAWRQKFVAVALLVAVIAAPLLLNRLLVVRLFDRATRPGSNFIYGPYGMLRGTDWHDAYDTFGGDRKKIRAATLQLLKEKPHRLLHAIRRPLRTFFWESYAFTFMGPDWTRVLGYALVFALALGIARASRSPYDGFSAAVAGGIIASVPFAPPADCDLMRAYAATMPLQACLAASGIGALVRLVAPAFRKAPAGPARLIETHTAPDDTPAIATASGALTLALVFVLPLGRSVLMRESAEFIQLTEKQPQDFPPGLTIHLVPDQAPRSFPNTVRIGDFRKRLGGLQGYIYPKEASWLATLRPGISILSAGNRKIILVATEKLERNDSRVEFDKFQVAWLPLAVDRDLNIPIPADAKLEPQRAGDRAEMSEVVGGTIAGPTLTHRFLTRIMPRDRGQA